VPFIGPQIDHNRIAELHKQYQEALQRKDYEEARRLFDEIIKELGKGVIRGPGAKIAAFFGSILIGAPLKILASVVSIVMMWSFHALNRLFPEQSHWLARKIMAMYNVFPDEWAKFATEYLQNFLGVPVTYTDIKERGGRGLADWAAMGMGERFLNPILGLFQDHITELTPEVGVENAERFILLNLGFQMQSWTLHMLGDICSFGMFKSMKDLPNAIAWTYGIGWLSWIAMGPWFRALIADPLNWQINKTWRPKMLSPDIAVKAMRLGFIEKSEFREIMAREGYSEEYIRAFLEAKEPAYTDSEIESLWRHWGYPDEDLIQEYLRRGFSGARAMMKLSELKTERKYKLIEKIGMASLKLCIEGKVNRGEVEELLRLAGLTDEEIRLEFRYAELRAREEKELTKAEIWGLYEAGKISWGEAKRRLEGLGYVPEQAEEILVSRRKGLTVSELVQAWKAGYISRSELMDRLVRMGYSVEDAELLVKLKG